MLSVIIPTYNRIDSLLKTLDSYRHQTISPDSFEVIIVDDCSTDGTAQAILQQRGKWPFTVKFFRLSKNRGPATARNIAIRKAKGDLLFITGDDIIATPTLFEEHLLFQKLHPGAATLGYSVWHRKAKVTQFMQFIFSKGHQFDYSVPHGSYIDYGKFYTSNISVPAVWFRQELFDERFPYAAFEDVELGYRLQKKGLKILFNKYAKAYHYHHIAEDEFYRKTMYGGAASVVMYTKHPELKNMSNFRWKVRVASIILSAYPVYKFLFKLLKKKEYLWNLNILYYSLKGIKVALKNPQKKVTFS